MEEYIKEYKIIEKTEIQKEIELIKTIIDTREKLKEITKILNMRKEILLIIILIKLKQIKRN